MLLGSPLLQGFLCFSFNFMLFKSKVHYGTVRGQS